MLSIRYKGKYKLKAQVSEKDVSLGQPSMEGTEVGISHSPPPSCPSCPPSSVSVSELADHAEETAALFTCLYLDQGLVVQSQASVMHCNAM